MTGNKVEFGSNRNKLRLWGVIDSKKKKKKKERKKDGDKERNTLMHREHGFSRSHFFLRF